MDCNNAKELLSFYVYDEIEDRDRRRLDAHLQVCGTCTRELENFRVVREAMGDLPDPEVPADFLVGVRARLEQPVTVWEQVDEAMAVLTGRRAVAGASVALAASFAFLVANTSGDLSAPPSRLQATRQETEALASGATAKRFDAAPASAEEKSKELVGVDRDEESSTAGGLPAAAAPAAPAREPQRLRSAAPMDPVAEPAPVADRRSAAESFDDVFGEPEAEEVEVPAPVVASAPAPAAPPPPRTVSRARASAQPPSSPFLERKTAGAKKNKVAARSLSSMGANELGQELALLEEARRSRRSRPTESDLSIFAPDVAGEAAPLAGGAFGAGSDYAERDDLGAADGFGGGTALARISDGDPFDSGAGAGPGREALFADAPRVPPVTIAFLRTTFGRSVHVLQPTQVSRFPAQVGRDLGLRSGDPRGALQGIHSLLEAGLGLELQGVEMRQGEEVALLVSFASGDAGRRALDRFVEDLRGLAGTAIASDVASADGGELGRMARISLPTP